MTLLSDYDILDEMRSGSIIIDPYSEHQLQPASYDVRLDDTLLIPNPELDVNTGIDIGHVDTSTYFKKIKLYDREHPHDFWLPPGGVALGCTQELLTLSPTAPLAADIAGCSSLGRWWLQVHMTAGFVDPGWMGKLTLELYNASPWWLRLWAGQRIAQIRFYETRNRPTRSYLDTGHYAGATTVLPSEYHG